MAPSPTPSSAHVRRVRGRKKLNRAGRAPSRTMLPVIAITASARAHSRLRPTSEPDDRRAPPAALGRRVGEALDQQARGQDLVDAPPLHTPAAAVDQPDLAEARLRGGFEVGLHDRRDLARREGVQVERVLDRYDDGAAHGRAVVDRAYLETGMGAACPAGTASAYAMT